MLISDVDRMEVFVKKHKMIMWDDKSPHGYDALMLVRAKNPEVYTDARFINGKWWRTRTIPLTENGWQVPNVNRKA